MLLRGAPGSGIAEAQARAGFPPSLEPVSLPDPSDETAAPKRTRKGKRALKRAAGSEPEDETPRDTLPEVLMTITLPKTLADALDAASRPAGSGDGTHKGTASSNASRGGRRNAEGAGNAKDSQPPAAPAADGTSKAVAVNPGSKTAGSADNAKKAAALSSASGSGTKQDKHGLASTWPFGAKDAQPQAATAAGSTGQATVLANSSSGMYGRHALGNVHAHAGHAASAGDGIGTAAGPSSSAHGRRSTDRMAQYNKAKGGTAIDPHAQACASAAVGVIKHPGRSEGQEKGKGKKQATSVAFMTKDSQPGVAGDGRKAAPTSAAVDAKEFTSPADAVPSRDEGRASRLRSTELSTKFMRANPFSAIVVAGPPSHYRLGGPQPPQPPQQLGGHSNLSQESRASSSGGKPDGAKASVPFALGYALAGSGSVASQRAAQPPPSPPPSSERRE